MDRPITKYEYARLIGERAEQIARGSPPLCDIDKMTNPISIAEKEFQTGTIPITINRILPNGQTVQVDLLKKIS